MKKGIKKIAKIGIMMASLLLIICHWDVVANTLRGNRDCQKVPENERVNEYLSATFTELTEINVEGGSQDYWYGVGKLSDGETMIVSAWKSQIPVVDKKVQGIFAKNEKALAYLTELVTEQKLSNSDSFSSYIFSMVDENPYHVKTSDYILLIIGVLGVLGDVVWMIVGRIKRGLE